MIQRAIDRDMERGQHGEGGRGGRREYIHAIGIKWRPTVVICWHFPKDNFFFLRR